MAAISFILAGGPLIGHWPLGQALNRQFERTPERVARSLSGHRTGRICDLPYAQGTVSTHGAPDLSGMELARQVISVPSLPGPIVASNLTFDPETGAGKWTDDEIARAIR